MALHYIADDLRNHAWYEQLFVGTIEDVEAYVGLAAAADEPVGAAPIDESDG